MPSRRLFGIDDCLALSARCLGLTSPFVFRGPPLESGRLVRVRGLWRPHRVRLKPRFNWYQAWFSRSAAPMSTLLRGEAGVEAANCLSDVAFVDHKT
jgi:hypothetical protein